MIVGIDLDNTIVSYDALFRDIAADAGLIDAQFAGGKRVVRETLRARDGGERAWQWLQAQAYGPRLTHACPFPGVADFVRACRAAGVPVYVVSHKSEYAAAEPHGTNLHAAARAWLAREFEDDAFSGVFFERTRAEKLARIAAVGCTHFIDDLSEVFAEPAFPNGVERWLFDPQGTEPEVAGVARFASWLELQRGFERERSLRAFVERSTGAPAERFEPAPRGGNNRIDRVVSGGRPYALKRYAPAERSRLHAEFAALEFLAECGVACVPRPVAADASLEAALYEWIEGQPALPPMPGDVARAVAFAGVLHAARERPAARRLPAAAEAVLRPADLLEQIERRLSTLRSATGELDGFLAQVERELRRPGAQRVLRAEAAPLEERYRTLSPSDFGFHNAIRRDGSLVFVDFEYFGWDDPVKLVCDFVLHPGMSPAPADIKEWLAGTGAVFGDDPGYAARLEAYHPFFALKWSLIVLNEFRPEIWRRRSAAAPGLSWEQAKRAQMEKAAALLNRARSGEPLAGR